VFNQLKTSFERIWPLKPIATLACF